MANFNTKLFKSLNESEYRELYTSRKVLNESSTDINEVAEDYKKAYHIDLDLKKVPCVIARDKFLSGWGGAEGKTHYQVVLCGDSTEASNIEDNMKSIASEEGLANVRRDFGVHLSSKVSASYVVGRYAPAWNNLSKSWYESRYDSDKTQDEIQQEKDAQEERRQEKLRQKEQQANESEELDESIISDLKQKHLANKIGKAHAKMMSNENTSKIDKKQYDKNWKKIHNLAKKEQDKELSKAKKNNEKSYELSKKADEHVKKANSASTKVDNLINQATNKYLDKTNESEEVLEEFKVGDVVKVPYKYGVYTPGEFTDAPIIEIEDGKYVTVEVPSKQVVMMDQLKKWNNGIDESEELQEKYSDKLGGDPMDFAHDVMEIKRALSNIDTNQFGSRLAQQMVYDWIDTCDYQIAKGTRLASGNELYTESEKKELKEDEDTVHKMKDCTDDIEVIMALEGDTLELDDIEDWNRLKIIAKDLASSQGFYSRLYAEMEEYSDDELEFPIYM